MKIISWNLNGLQSCIKNQSFNPILARNPDVLCCQEIRTQQFHPIIDGYHHFWNPSSRDGYSGTLIASRTEPLSVCMGLGVDRLDSEGRVISIEFDDFYVVNAYAPNSQKNLERHSFRLDWDEAFRNFLAELNIEKPVIACGDFNVALSEIDVFPENMRQYWAQQGYDSDERANLKLLLEDGFVDVFRYVYPDLEGAYTWWSNRLNKRLENRGWRLDYFFVAEELIDTVKSVTHLVDIGGSDHCPIEMVIES